MSQPSFVCCWKPVHLHYRIAIGRQTHRCPVTLTIKQINPLAQYFPHRNCSKYHWQNHLKSRVTVTCSPSPSDLNTPSHSHLFPFEIAQSTIGRPSIQAFCCQLLRLLDRTMRSISVILAGHHHCLLKFWLGLIGGLNEEGIKMKKKKVV